jgi:hypothetical protein
VVEGARQFELERLDYYGKFGSCNEALRLIAMRFAACASFSTLRSDIQTLLAPSEASCTVKRKLRPPSPRFDDNYWIG